MDDNEATELNFRFLKANVKAAAADHSEAGRKLAQMDIKLQEMCQKLYGHDYGPDNEDIWCTYCEGMNDALLKEADEEEQFEYRYDPQKGIVPR